MGEIRENQRAKLFFKTANGSEKEFDCSIKTVYSDRLALNFPRELISYADYLQEGDEIDIKIFTPFGIKTFDAMILDPPTAENFIIESIEDFIKIVQRRKYLRMDLNTKVIIQKNEKVNIVTKTLDISAGGIRFIYEGQFNENESVGCMLYLPMELNSIRAQGIILKGGHLPENEHVLLFTKIEERDRDKIVKTCFDIESGRYNKNEETEKI